MQSLIQFLPRVVSSLPPQAQVLAAILSIQLGAAIATNIFSTLGPAGTVFFRLALSALILTLTIRPKFTKPIVKHYKILIPYGITIGLMNWCFYESIARIPLGIAVTIEFMGPLLVATLSSRRFLDLLWISVALVGVLFLSPSIGKSLDQIGVMFAVLAGIGWGGFVLVSKRVIQVLPGSDGLAIGMIVASVLLLPFSMSSLSFELISISLVGNLILLAILATTIPFYLEFSALKTLSPQAYGILITFEPAVAAIIGVIFLGDSLGIQGVVAIACVTIAAIGSTLTQNVA